MRWRNYLLFLLIFLSTAIFSGCAAVNNYGPYKGKVIDAETKEPLEGAVVFMECKTMTPNLAGANWHFVDFKEVLTDNKGEFHLNLFATSFRIGHLWDNEPYIIVFKPGYGAFPMHEGTSTNISIKDAYGYLPENTYVTISLTKLRTKEERKINLRHISLPSPPEVPFEKFKNLLYLTNIEGMHLGLDPLYQSPREVDPNCDTCTKIGKPDIKI